MIKPTPGRATHADSFAGSTERAAAPHTERIPLVALDGGPLSLVHVTGPYAPARGPVLLVHGAGVRAEIFRPPLRRTVVDALLDAGWDVWLLNWRASIDFEPLDWTLDAAAVNDYRPAIDHIKAATGADTLKAIVHCQGSTSFSMAVVAGLLPEVNTVISNAVSLHPVIPAWSRFKIGQIAPLVTMFSPYLSPAWGYRSNGRFSKVLRTLVRVTHPECSNSVCRLVSFTYGSGRPALWSHTNLDAKTHDWITGEFADVPMTFFAQMHRSVAAGHLVHDHRYPELPDDIVAQAPKTDARFALLGGQHNRCFLPESQQQTHAFLSQQRPRRGDTFHLLRGYGHLDVFFGRNAWRDTYPIILEELDK